MSKKNGGGGFDNYAAKRFSDITRIDQYSEDEIYRILKSDISIILKQLSSSRSGGNFPEYAVNMFANISAAKFVYEYVELWSKQINKKGESELMSIDDVASMRRLVSEAFVRKDKFQAQQLDEKDRNRMLLRTYAMLDPGGIEIAKKLKFGEKKKNGKIKYDMDLTTELVLRVANQPKFTIERVGKLFDMSTVSTKKKLKVLKKLCKTKTRFVEYIGAALTISRAVTDFASMAYDVIIPPKEANKKHVSKKMRKHRLPYLRAYATVFKKRRSFNTLLTDDFYEKNKKVIKTLIREDAGFKKAFRVLKAPAGSVKVSRNDSFGKNKNKKGHDKAPWGKESRAAVPRNAELSQFLNDIKPGRA